MLEYKSRNMKTKTLLFLLPFVRGLYLPGVLLVSKVGHSWKLFSLPHHDMLTRDINDVMRKTRRHKPIIKKKTTRLGQLYLHANCMEFLFFMD